VYTSKELAEIETSSLSLRLPDSIHRHIREIARRAKKQTLKKTLDRVPDRPPVPGDER